MSVRQKLRKNEYAIFSNSYFFTVTVYIFRSETYLQALLGAVLVTYLRTRIFIYSYIQCRIILSICFKSARWNQTDSYICFKSARCNF